MSDSEVNQPLPTRREVEAHRGPCIHEARSAGQADVYELIAPWQGFLLKDFSPRPWWARALITRRALAREAAALDALGDLEGVPRLAARLDADAVVVERLDAERLPHRRDNFLTPEFFDRLQDLLAQVHARGWAHGDLRRKNILVCRDSLRPFLIDFATAWHGGPGAGPIGRFVFRRLAAVDRVTVAKLKGAYLPDALSQADRATLASAPWHLRAGRFVRKRLYRPFKKRHREALWRAMRNKFTASDREETK